MSSFSLFVENVRILDPWHLNYHHGQNDYVIYAVQKENGQDIVVGKLEYSEYNGEIYIKWIEVVPELRGNNISQEMVKKLTSNVPYNKIQWGMTTDDGTKLKKKLDKVFS